MLRTLMFVGLLAQSAIQYVAAQHGCQTTKHRHSSMPGGTRSDEGELATWPWDLLHQRIDLDLTQGNVIGGACTITAVPRTANATELPLHLLELTVDSVTTGHGPLSFTHDDELLTITTDVPFDTDDTLLLTVHYHGDPVTDPSGFGGFYTTSPYTYNLGVAFQRVPHSFGRAWFPCVDNFTERNSYEFLVKTNGGRTAWCNGELLATIPLRG
jgi:aminopeptidase N